jgi:hypothetical protein
MKAADHYDEEILCGIDKSYTNYSAAARKLYLAVKGGDVCAHYEIAIETFTTSCSEAIANAYHPKGYGEDTASHGSPGARECPPDSADCILSMRHFMGGSCGPGAESPPFILQIPFEPGQQFDNLVLEVEDLSPQVNPKALMVSLFSGMGVDRVPVRTISEAKGRIYSFGLSVIDMADMFCDETCAGGGTAILSMTVQCTTATTAFRVISLATPMQLALGTSAHGEVCPNSWIFHKLDLLDTTEAREAKGIRFFLHVHKGDVSALMTRWRRTPSFSACNANELPMSPGDTEGHVDLCHLSEELDAAAQRAEMYAQYLESQSAASRQRRALGDGYSQRRALGGGGSAVSSSGKYDPLAHSTEHVLSDTMVDGIFAVYGGTACAYYSITVEYIPLDGSNCSSKVEAMCSHPNHVD